MAEKRRIFVIDDDEEGVVLFKDYFVEPSRQVNVLRLGKQQRASIHVGGLLW